VIGSPAFICTFTPVGSDAAWVRVAGELDIETAPELQQTLRDAESLTRLVALDLRDVTFIDSTGLRTIVDASSRARRADRRLVLLRGSTNVDRLLTLTGTAAMVELADVDPAHPPIHALRQLAEARGAS
jgi:anti-sigma B factor antagonist